MIFASSVSSAAKCLSESNASVEAVVSSAEALWWSPLAGFGPFLKAGAEVEKLEVIASGVVGWICSTLGSSCQYFVFFELVEKGN